MKKTAQLAHAERLMARAEGAVVGIDKLWQTIRAVASAEVISLLRKAREAAYAEMDTWQQEVARVRKDSKADKQPAKVEPVGDLAFYERAADRYRNS